MAKRAQATDPYKNPGLRLSAPFHGHGHLEGAVRHAQARIPSIPEAGTPSVARLLSGLAILILPVAMPKNIGRWHERRYASRGMDKSAIRRAEAAGCYR
jgi:hypothetical protein